MTTPRRGGAAVDAGVLERLVRIGGQPFLVEMIELFLSNAPDRLRRARVAAAAGEWTALYQAAHSIKSTAGNLGARALRDAAEAMQDRAARADGDAVRPLLDDVVMLFEEARTELVAERDRRGGRSP